MKLYLAPESSLGLMRYLRSTSGKTGLFGKPMRKRALVDALHTARALQELDYTAHLWLEHAGDPVHAYVPSREKGTSTKHLTTHVLAGQVPHGALLDIGHDICICAPHFLLMSLSTQLDAIDTVRLGMELCGTYSAWRLDPFSRAYNEFRDCTFEIPAAMRLKRAQAFIDGQQGGRGTRGAKAALRWVAENAASPMETAVYLLLCLPKRLGGYGLPRPILNPKLIVSNPDGAKERYPDLFWMGANIDVEYNSDAAHSGEWARYRDSKREVELTVAQVKVLPLTRLQLMNVDEFHAFAQGLRRMLGVRARALEPDWVVRRDELRRRLLADWAEH